MMMNENGMQTEPRLISAEILETLATRRPAKTEAEQRRQKLRSEQAAGLRATENHRFYVRSRR